jgi:protocatechuate 3,4-dioxygenase beta subunit
VSAQVRAPAPQAGQADKRPGIIRGRILGANGRPARRASVRILEPTGGFPRSVSADMEGRYEFADVTPGDYRVTAGKPGYLSLEFGQQRAFERGTVITIRAGETLERIDITLPASGAISGRIFDANGDPVEGIGVELMQLQFGANRRVLIHVAGVGRRLTNDQGRYRLFGVPPGRYLVMADLAADPRERSFAILPSGYVSTFAADTPVPAAARMVAVGLSDQIEDVDVTLARIPTSRVSGTVFDAHGAPLRIGLLLSRSMRSGALIMEPLNMVAGADGRFEFPNVLDGEWVLQAFGGADVNRGQEGEFVSRIVTVAGTDVSDLRLQTSIGSRIEGRIVFEGTGSADPTGVTLMTMPSDFDRAPLAGPTGRATGRPDGTFALEGLIGPRRLRLMRAPPSWRLKAIRANGRDITDEPLSFGTKDESLADVEVVLTNSESGVTGRVADARGQVVTDYTVVAFATSADRWYQGSRFLGFTRPKMDGAFEIAGLPPGQYYVAAVDRLQGTAGFGEWQDPVFLESIAPRAARVTVTDGQLTAVTPRLIVR